MLSGCTPSPAALTTQLLGRWQRVGEGNLTESYVFAEYVEFRPGEERVELLWDPGSQRAWTINVSRYAVLQRG